MTEAEYNRSINRGEHEIEIIEQEFLNDKITREERDKLVREIEYDLAEIEREWQREEEYENEHYF